MSMKRCRSRLAVGVAVVALTATGPAALAAPFTSLYSPASAALVGQTIRVLPFVGSDDPSNTGPIRPNVSSGVCPTIVSFEAPQLEFDMIGASDSQAKDLGGRQCLFVATHSAKINGHQEFERSEGFSGTSRRH